MKVAVTRSIVAAIAGGAGLTVAGPFAAPVQLPEAPLPAWTSGGIVSTSLEPASLGGARGILALSPELDRLSFLDPDGGPARVIDADLRGGSAVTVIDAEGDGDQDVVAASRWRRELYLYPNAGDGTFGPRVVLATDMDTAIGLVTADLNGDSHDDVAGITDHDRRVFVLQGSSSGLQPVQTLYQITK